MCGRDAHTPRRHRKSRVEHISHFLPLTSHPSLIPPPQGGVGGGPSLSPHLKHLPYRLCFFSLKSEEGGEGMVVEVGEAEELNGEEIAVG